MNPGLHSLELEKFPRCYDRIPERMKERLASRGPGIAVHERLRIGGAMDIARGCTLLDGDVTNTLELPWAVCTQDSVLWGSRTYTPPDPAALGEFDPADLLLVVDKNIKVLDGESDIEVVLSAADEVATEIMDRLHRPWPEVPRTGTVLEVGLADGDLVWASGGRTVCRLGFLGHALRALA